MPTQAIYVSVWDDSDEVRTSCVIDMEQDPPFVTNISTADDTGGWDCCTRQYVELPNGEEVETFSVDGDYNIVDGQPED